MKTITELRTNAKNRRDRWEIHRDSVIDAVSVFVPVMAPLVPAALTWVAIWRQYPALLDIPSGAALAIGFIAALAVESLGVLSVETSLSMWQWNKEHDDQAPLALAVSAAAVYIVTVISLVVLLKVWPDFTLYSLVPLTTLGVIASVIAVSRKQHGERVYQHELSKEQAAIDAAKSVQSDAKTTVKKPSKSRQKPVKKTSTSASANDRRVQIMAILDAGESVNPTSIARQLDVSRGTIYNDLEALAADGHAHKNGNGWQAVTE